MDRLSTLAEQVAKRLVARKETIAVAESSTGGLISAALIAVPGASAYFLGGGVIYTGVSRLALLGVTAEMMGDIRSASEPMARLLAGTIRERLSADWGLAETGASGPTGNRYGDAAGHSCLAAAGPQSRSLTLETGSGDRGNNMEAFAVAALTLMAEMLGADPV